MKRPPRLSVSADPPRPWSARPPRRPWQLRPTLFWVVLSLGLLFALHLFQLAFSGRSQPLNHVGPTVTALPASPLAQPDQPAAALSTPETEPVLVTAEPRVVSRQPYVRAWIPPTPAAQRAAERPAAGRMAPEPQNGSAPLSVAQGPQATPAQPIPSSPVAATATPAATASPAPRPSPTPSRKPRPTASNLGATTNAVCEEISHESTPIDIRCPHVRR